MKQTEKKLEDLKCDSLTNNLLLEDLDKTYAYLKQEDLQADDLLSSHKYTVEKRFLFFAKTIQQEFREKNLKQSLYKDTLEGVFTTLHACYSHEEDKASARTFPIEVVGLVIFLAVMAGNKFLDAISDFWIERHPVLHLFIPNIPSIDHELSFATLNNTLRLLSADAMKDMFSKYFSVFERQNLPQELSDKFDITISCEEQNALKNLENSYTCEDLSSKAKDDAQSAPKARNLKNKEPTLTYRQLLAPLWSKISVFDDYVYCTEPFNHKKEVLEKLNLYHRFEYAANADNDVWYDTIDSVFKEFEVDNKADKKADKKTDKKASDPFIVPSAKLKDWTFTFIPASTIFKRQTFPKNVRTLLCCKKTSSNSEDEQNTVTLVKTDSSVTKYYICSVKFSDKDNLKLIVKGFEYYQGVPNTLFMQDASYPADYDEVFVDLDYDWMLYEILAYFRALNAITSKYGVTYRDLVNRYKDSPELALMDLVHYFALGAPKIKKTPRSLPPAISGDRSYDEYDPYLF